jgi:hypothetical protein
MNPQNRIRNVTLVLIGVLVLLLKGYYAGPSSELIHSYLGNLSISFSLYFLTSINAEIWGNNKLINAIIPLIVVELFEVTNGFGIMKNVFDIYDLIANLFGIIIALGVEFSIDKIASLKMNQ